MEEKYIIIIAYGIFFLIGFIAMFTNSRKDKELERAIKYLDTLNDEVIFNDKKTNKEKVKIIDELLEKLEKDNFKYHGYKKEFYKEYFTNVRKVYEKSNEKTGQK